MGISNAHYQYTMRIEECQEGKSRDVPRASAGAISAMESYTRAQLGWAWSRSYICALP